MNLKGRTAESAAEAFASRFQVRYTSGMALGQLGIPKPPAPKTPASLPPGAKASAKTALKTMALLGVAYTAHAVNNVFHKEEGKIKAAIEDARPPSNLPTESSHHRVWEKDGELTAASRGSSVTNAFTPTLDAERTEYLKKFDNPVYLARAKGEGIPDPEVAARKERVERTPVYYKDVDALLPPSGEVAAAITVSTLDGTPQKVEVAINNEQVRAGRPVLPHELRHVETRGAGVGMSDYAQKLYSESFLSTSSEDLQKGYMRMVNPRTGQVELLKLQDEDVAGTSFGARGYLLAQKEFRKNHERDARKVEFEIELSRRGIKQYGEPYTPEIHRKVMELYMHHQLSQGSFEFIMFTDPSDVAKIMNTIAADGVKTAADTVIGSTA